MKFESPENYTEIHTKLYQCHFILRLIHFQIIFQSRCDVQQVITSSLFISNLCLNFAWFTVQKPVRRNMSEPRLLMRNCSKKYFCSSNSVNNAIFYIARAMHWDWDFKGRPNLEVYAVNKNEVWLLQGPTFENSRRRRRRTFRTRILWSGCFVKENVHILKGIICCLRQDVDGE